MFNYTSFCIDEDIEEYNLSSFFAKQLMLIDESTANFDYRDEFEAMSILYGEILDEPLDLIHRTSIELLKGKRKLEEDKLMSNVHKRIQLSQKTRQKGNGLFNANKNNADDKSILLMVCHLYTSAIWAAIDTNNEELALGFTNRGMALQSFGYYQQAYDDCVCALNLNYQPLKHHKIIKRQAYCSIKLNDLVKAEKHLADIQDLSLNKDNDIEIQKLLQALEELRQVTTEKSIQSTGDNESDPISKTKECLITGKGRGMLTTCTIKENEFIFSDRASAFLPNFYSPLCHQCGATNLIPIPCTNCRGLVKYCSLKCQQEHSVMHAYECPAFRCNLFTNNENVHLVLRMLFDNGIFSILEELQLDNKISTSQVWYELREGGKIWQNKNTIPYAKVLRMITHFSKKSPFEQKSLILLSHYCVTYLKLFTNCFEKLNAKNKLINWELLIASLILLHYGQKLANCQSLFAITIIPSKFTNRYPYHMLNANLWKSPWHLKPGRLSFFSNIAEMGSLILPEYSLCNHACNLVFQVKFSGRFVSTYALNDFVKDEELTTCYTPTYLNQKRKTRHSKLKNKFHFDCKCKHCCDSDEDLEFNKFNLYRCDNKICGQVFVPNENQINWYLDKSPLNCTICGHKQTMEEFYKISNSLSRSDEPHIRRLIYKNFMKMKEWCLELNEARCKSANELIYAWFMVIQESKVSLNNQDYSELIIILKYALNFTDAQHSQKSHKYLAFMTYLWDLMALRKYNVANIEMKEMLIVIDIILDNNSRQIFLNYYNDYIKNYIENQN